MKSNLPKWNWVRWDNLNARIPAAAPSFVRPMLMVVHQQRLLLLAFLFLVALGIRLYASNEPPLDFHATRQYRSLLIAREYYYQLAPTVPAWQQEVARVNRQRQGTLEPPLMELLVAGGYLLAGGEHYWVPRFLSSLWWIMGAAILYLIARRLVDAVAALFATAFYLFLPFAVVASRSFQPDPLMVMLLLASVLAIIRYHEQPSGARFAIAAFIAALTFFVKPVGIFPVFGLFMSVAIWRRGTLSVFRSLDIYGFWLLSLLPTALFYIYGIFVAEFLRTQAQASFLPQLLLQPFFWRGWLGNIHTVVGFAAFTVALTGVLLFRPGLPRAAIVGLWVGYGLFCLVFNYHIATHDYYHLQLIPIVALSLGPVASLVVARVLDLNRTWYARAALVSLALFALLMSLGVTRTRLAQQGFDRQIQIAEKVGQQINHSTRTVYLAADYGLSLEYHGQLSGEPWPLVSDLEWERLAGQPAMSAEERFNTWFAQSAPDYFIIMDLREWEQQPDLGQYLTAHYPLLVQQDEYLIFDLRHALPISLLVLGAG